MSETRRLVVNADDLGLAPGVNDGIFDAHAQGVLTSASLFANAPATEDAIGRVLAEESLGVGVHLALVDGAPTLPPARIRSLVSADGQFRRSWKPFVTACLCGQVSLAEVELELEAQIERLRGAGLTLTHLDAHKHVHAYPPVFAIVARLAARFRIPVVRVPYERLAVGDGGAQSLSARTRQLLLNAALLPWARRDYRTAAALDLRTPRFVGRIHTGVLDLEGLAGLVRELTPCVTELMVHPGYVDAPLERTGTRLLASRRAELELLRSPEACALLAAERVDLLKHDLTHVRQGRLRHVS